MSRFELVAALLGAISVGLVVRRNVWAFPVGIVMVAMYGWIFFQAKLYSDMLLQVLFIVLQVQGWIDWNKSDKATDDRIVVRRFEPRQWWITLMFQVLGTLLLGALMKRFTDAALPWLDAFAAIMSTMAQWWMNKRYLENWVLWIAVDLLYLFIYYSRGLLPTTILYGLFLVMAVVGHWEWRKRLAMAQKPLLSIK